MENNLWGNKNLFAIEIGSYDAKLQKGKLRLWLNGEPYGDFKRAFKLSYAISSFKNLINGRDSLYSSEFENKSEEDIFIYCLLLDKKIEEFTQADYERAEKFKSFSFYFGDQLDNVANVIYLKDGVYHFIWSMNNDFSGKQINYLKNLKFARIPAIIFESIVSSFLEDT